MAESKDDLMRQLETNRVLASVMTALGKLAEAQVNAISGVMSHAIGDLDEMKNEYSSAMAAIREANLAIRESSERLESIVLADLQKRLGEGADD